MTIALFTTDEALYDQVATFLPGVKQVMQVISGEHFQNYLTVSFPSPTNIPNLLLLDSKSFEDNEHLAGYCRSLRLHPVLQNLPMIAIVERFELRQALFDLGVKSCIYLPLVKAELETHLAPYLPDVLQSQNWHIAKGHTTYDAFSELLTQTIGSQFESGEVASLILERLVPLLHATAGAIWLRVDHEREFELAASLASLLSWRPVPSIRYGQGLLGWVLKHQAPLFTRKPVQDPRYLPATDAFSGAESFACMAIPLIHAQESWGILAIYEQSSEALSEEAFLLLNRIAPLAAAALANVNNMRELRDYAHQQQVLYEMSRQIATGLDLKTTLNRALQWMSRLCEVEMALLWMLENQEGWLEPVATVGLDIQQARQIARPLRELAIAQVILSRERLVINAMIEISSHYKAAFTQAGLSLQTLLVLPLRYRGDVIGVLSLLNKIGGAFTKADETLLTTAVEMISIAIGNARLHAKTLALMEASERMHLQSAQNERLATVGRLTASLSHEINNPMQAIRGALTLALEELDQPDEVAAYLNLSLEEADRVVKLVNRLRAVYRPKQDEPEEMNVNDVLEEALAIARKEFSRQDVQVKTQFARDIPRTLGIPSQLHLVFLSLLLNMSDSIGAIEGGTLVIQTGVHQDMVELSFFADAAIMPVAPWLETLKSGETVRETNVSFGSSLSHDIIKAHFGNISIDEARQQIIVRIQLPIETPITDSGIYAFTSSSHR